MSKKFMTFTMGINNWPTFTTTLKNLHIQHFGEKITNKNSSLNNKNIENFVNKYIITNQSTIQIEICATQIYQG
jgi:phage replication-related protein YjqB (UPF0714/DUF867 family)